MKKLGHFLKHRVFSLLLLLLCPCVTNGATELRLLTEEWAPISYQEEGIAKGYAVELVQALIDEFSLGGQIEVLPWARAY